MAYGDKHKHKDIRPHDHLGNAGHPNNWWGVVTNTGKKNGTPVEQNGGTSLYACILQRRAIAAERLRPARCEIATSSPNASVRYPQRQDRLVNPQQ